jgi:hypothetical protein
MLRHLVLSVASFSLTVAAGFAPARADCSAEVLEAVKKQSQLKSFRVVSNVITENGPMKLTTDYILPDKMRQVAVLASDPDTPLETILMSDKAWANAGSGWQEVPFEEVQYLTQQMKTATGALAKSVGAFDCMGVETYEGRAQRGYKSKPVLPEGVKLPEGTNINEILRNDAVRMVYIDAESGLPARSLFAKPDKLDKPIFQESYFYPADIAIEAPKNVLAEPPTADGVPQPAPASPADAPKDGASR